MKLDDKVPDEANNDDDYSYLIFLLKYLLGWLNLSILSSSFLLLFDLVISSS